MKFEHHELKLSEIIAQLQDLMETYGDLRVMGEYEGFFVAEELLADVRGDGSVVLELN